MARNINIAEIIQRDPEFAVSYTWDFPTYSRFQHKSAHPRQHTAKDERWRLVLDSLYALSWLTSCGQSSFLQVFAADGLGEEICLWRSVCLLKNWRETDDGSNI